MPPDFNLIENPKRLLLGSPAPCIVRIFICYLLHKIFALPLAKKKKSNQFEKPFMDFPQINVMSTLGIEVEKIRGTEAHQRNNTAECSAKMFIHTFFGGPTGLSMHERQLPICSKLKSSFLNPQLSLFRT